ncbi:MAG TPA: efflux RND transporter periplasmic adaptor subunit [Thermoguttaceae bacterium]|nr:efflux RND transporter periplasmic adaptor subunit [Thermoguttaceae bacterium]
MKTLMPPMLFIASGIALIFLLGLAQRMGWISAGGGGVEVKATATTSNTRYICPMMCTPPQSEPGRCPVCAMELVPLTSDGGDSDEMSVSIQSAARRLANIQTAAARSIPLTRSIRTVGEIEYDEGSLATIAAYFDGRIERLLADYTGVEVQAGEQMALIYSPALYSAQVELVEAKRGLEASANTTIARVKETQLSLFQGARQKLVELGMTKDQVQQLEQSLQPESRMYICAPIGGTVIEKLAVEGQYVKTGQPVYRIADLSTVWLQLQLFPEDAAHIRYGQRVEIEVQSLPGRKLTGRVAFVDPMVDPKTRTVGVRVVLANEHGVLKPGDYATANITVEVLPSQTSGQQLVYDPEMAGKWISPRHPQIIEDHPGVCRECGIELVPTSEFGFADKPIADRDVVVVPRSAVLMAGQSSVVYVETDPGRFEIRPVVLGEVSSERAVILEGIDAGELVATNGNFLIDSQMQLAGNPSLINPTKANSSSDLDEADLDEAKSAKLLAALSKLSADDRALAEKQRICPVTELPLGSMGTPIKVDVNGQPVFICCEGCRTRLLGAPAKYLAKLFGEAVR